tara:strand:+ start:211 stop:720 length:510 start_codon:yes stop_codon:yes gene_type:complete
MFRVEEIGIEIANDHNIPVNLVAYACLGHDIARGMPENDLLNYAENNNIPIDPIERQSPILLHGQVGSHILQHEEHINEKEILEAVWWHTTFQKNIGPIGQITFLADKLDERKLKQYPFQEEIRSLAKVSLLKAIVTFLSKSISTMIEKEQIVHPLAIETRNHLLQILK